MWITRTQADEYFTGNTVWTPLLDADKDLLLTQATSRLEGIAFFEEDFHRIGDKYTDGFDPEGVAIPKRLHNAVAELALHYHNYPVATINPDELGETALEPDDITDLPLRVRNLVEPFTYSSEINRAELASINAATREKVLDLEYEECPSQIPYIPDGFVTEPQLSTEVQEKLNIIAGQKGDKGDTGDQGIQGLTGSQGVAGPIGPQGQGTQGIQGEKGDTGSVGPIGQTGAQGVEGDTGDDGADSTVAGPQGVKGDTGDTGAKGDTGLQGVKGDTGAQGVQGIQGEEGEQGIPGTPDPQTDINTQAIAVNTQAIESVPLGITIPFTNIDTRIEGELGFPNQQGWTQGGTITKVDDTVFGDDKKVLRFTGINGKAETPTTAELWAGLFNYGGVYSSTMRYEAKGPPSDSSLLTGLGYSATQSPRVAGGKGRILVRLSINSTHTVIAKGSTPTVYIILDGTGGNPEVLKNEWFNFSVQIAPKNADNWGGLTLYINGIQIATDTVNVATDNAVSDKISIAKWGSTDLSTFALDNFGITAYTEPATKSLTVDEMTKHKGIAITTPPGIVDREVIIPDGAPRPIGATIKLIANNVGGTNTIRTNDVNAPQVLFNGLNTFETLIDFEKEITFTNLLDNANVYQGVVPEKHVETPLVNPSRLNSYLPEASPYTTPSLTADTATKVLIPNQVILSEKDFTFNVANNYWEFDLLGTTDKWLILHLTATVSAGQPSTVVTIQVYKNGAVVPNLAGSRLMSNTADEGNINIAGVLQLSHGDHIEGYVTLSNNTTATFKRFSLTINEQVGAVTI